MNRTMEVGATLAGLRWWLLVFLTTIHFASFAHAQPPAVAPSDPRAIQTRQLELLRQQRERAAERKAALARIVIAPVDADALGERLRAAVRVDELVDAGLRRAGVEPNPRTTDEQFVRRIHLDVVGRIPTAAEAEAFLRLRGPRERQRLIDRLLGDPGYASHAFNFWADVLRVVDETDDMQTLVDVYLRPYGQWLKRSLRENRPYDEFVREMLLAEGRVWENPATGYVLRDPGMPFDNLDNTMRAFLGTRIDCARCHDDPSGEWTQREYYELAAFLGGLSTSVPDEPLPALAAPTPMTLPYDDVPPARDDVSRRARHVFRLNRAAVWDDPRQRLRLPHDYVGLDGDPDEVVPPAVPFAALAETDSTASRREAFARWVTSPRNPRFTRTIVNRLWKRTFGRGLIEPVDDLRRDTVASNPELLAFLEEELVRLEFDLKEFERILFNTRAYQREATLTGVDPTKPYHFPGPRLRRMTAEQVWDSVLTLVRPDPDAAQRPSDDEYVEAITLRRDITVDELLKRAEQVVALELERERKRREERSYHGVEMLRASELPQPLPPDHFLRQFGQSDRQLVSRGSTDGSVPQLLTMFNGPVTHAMLEPRSVVHHAVLAGRDLDERIDVIFLSVLARKPDRRERVLARRTIREHGASGYGDVVWALLNTREFLFVQ